MRQPTIREERPGDIPSIRALIRAAFDTLDRTVGFEHEIVDQLRADGDLVLSLVATNMDEAVIGHIAFSPVTISDDTQDWYATGPVSVIPTRQRTGLGSQLAEEGFARMVAKGAQGFVLLGRPGNFAKFGFAPDPGLVLPNTPPEYFQARKLGDGPMPRGEVFYPPAFRLGRPD